MIAVVKTGGKQYKVREGEELLIERVPQKEGEVVDLEVLLLSDDEGKDVKVGAPRVESAKVEAKVIAHGLGKKVRVVKYKPKVRYTRNVGHRQPYSKIKIEKIVA